MKWCMIGTLQAILLVVNNAKVKASSNLSCIGDTSQMNRRRCRMLLIELFLKITSFPIFQMQMTVNCFTILVVRFWSPWNCLKPHSTQYPVIWYKKFAHVQSSTYLFTEHKFETAEQTSDILKIMVNDEQITEVLTSGSEALIEFIRNKSIVGSWNWTTRRTTARDNKNC